MTAHKLNPFQIEDQWEGDFYDDEDDMDEEYEVRGLLGAPSHRATTSIHQHAKKKSSVTRHNSLPIRRILAIFGVTVLLFWILLSATGTQRELPTIEKDDEQQQVLLPEEEDDQQPSLPNTSAPSSRSDTTTPTSVPTVAPTSNPAAAAAADQVDDFVPADRVPDADDDWNDDEEALRPVDTKLKPLFFVVLGERHSGVDYLLQTLQDCFGNTHRFGSGYNRPATWFQTNTDDTDVAFRMDASMHYRVILLLAVRNPIDWVYDMYQQPMYMGDHTFDKLKDFCRAPWTSTMPSNSTNGFCQYNFESGNVSPCLELQDPYRFPKNVPVYELDETGQPYGNIVQFRAAKIRHWTETIPKSWGISPMIVPMDNGWSNAFAQSLRNRTEGEDICMPTIPYEVTPYDRSSKKFLEWMNTTVDWDLEERIGYYSVQ